MGVFKFATTTYDLITLPLLLDKFKKKTIRIKVTWKFLKKMEECTFEVSDTGSFHVNSQILDQFNKHGYVVVRNLFTIEEISKLKDHFETHEDIQKHAYGRSDGNNRMSKLCIWNKAGDDLSGIVARSTKVAGTMQNLLGGDEIYHYHSKLMMKEPKTGGAHIWHQDYGYWYNNGCLLPEMGSVFIPVDKCTKENGCLKVLDGSHKMGRINHILEGDQAGADPERMKEALKIFPLVHVEMNPGDALFFHCNLLHRSDQNHSEFRRWVMITSYNKRKNNPVYEHHCPFYHPLNMISDKEILLCDPKAPSSSDKELWIPITHDSAKKNIAIVKI